MAEVTMSLEEYLQLVGSASSDPNQKIRKVQKISRKRAGKKDPKMGRALRKANAMGRKKNGGFKKGWTQGKIMKKAHQLRRRMR